MPDSNALSPTREQIEAHLAQYGFDYKPTVACAEDGVELPDSGAAEEPLTAAEIDAQQCAVLDDASRGPEEDGDPATMEFVFPDGSGGTIFISTDNPERFKDMTPGDLQGMFCGGE